MLEEICYASGPSGSCCSTIIAQLGGHSQQRCVDLSNGFRASPILGNLGLARNLGGHCTRLSAVATIHGTKGGTLSSAAPSSPP
jgi:hypothetical protein